MTHFWKAFSKSDVEHVWALNKFNGSYYGSACGHIVGSQLNMHAGTRHCKRCEKIIRRKK